MNSRLNDDMADLASEATSPDLYDRVISTSRRRLIRRNLFAGLAAIVMVTGGVIGVGTFTSPAESVEPVAGPAASDGEGADLTGKLFDASQAPNAGRYTLMSRTAWSEPIEVTKLTAVDTRSPRLSPDGGRLSWLSKPDDSDFRTLMVRDLDSGEDTEVTAEITADGDGCVFPTWSPDGSRLFVDRGDHPSGDRYGFFDVEGGRFTPVPGFRGCDAHVAIVSGQEVVYSIDGAEIYVSGLDDEATVTPIGAALESQGLMPSSVLAVSDTGELACVATLDVGSTDFQVGDGWACNAIVEVQTGAVLDLSGLGDWTANATVFDHPSGLIVHLQEEGNDGYTVDILALADYDGTVITEAEWYLRSDEFESLLVAYRH